MATNNLSPGFEPQLEQAAGGEESAHHLDDLFTCQLCKRTFSTKTGLGVHIRSAHKKEANDAVSTDRVKARWTTDEETDLIREEIKLFRSKAPTNMNVVLQRIFPKRSLEAIKGKRKSEAYRRKFVAALAKEDARSNPNIGSILDVNQLITGEIDQVDRIAMAQAVVEDEIDPIVLYLQELRQLQVGNTFLEDELNTILDLAVQGLPVTHKLDQYLLNIFGDLEKRGEKFQHPISPQPTRRREIRKKQYKEVQRLYKKNRSACARKVLKETLDDAAQPSMSEFLDTWRPIFNGKSGDVKRRGATHEDPRLWAPITVQELIRSRKSGLSAPGPDGVTGKLLRSVPAQVLTKLFNIMMLSKDLPKILKKNRTIFILKNGLPTDPSNYRPITMGSVIVRAFHRILAKRVEKYCDFNKSQRAFLRTDGCQENVALLSHLLKQAKDAKIERHFAILDLQKAYDSVSHMAIIEAARRKKFPESFLAYIHNSYSGSTTRFVIPGGMSEEVRMTRGVRQGDPLSPCLFNLIMDVMLDAIPDNIGALVGEERVSALAFADDLIMVAGSEFGLQVLLNHATKMLSPLGLLFNIKKCMTVSIVPSGRDKKIKVVTDTQFRIGDIPIKCLGIDDTWCYLGITFSPLHISIPNVSERYISLLTLLRRAPLKPQQRLFLLRVFAIPKLFHSLVLGATKLSVLKKLDCATRNAIRSWLRLPKDTPNTFFHAPVDEGGLGVPQFRWTVPRLRVTRLERLQQSRTAVFRALALESSTIAEVARARTWAFTGVDYLIRKDDVKKYQAENLHKAVDGRGLREANLVPNAHDWLKGGTNIIRGNQFVEAVRMRINAIPTRSRTSRGRPGQSRLCRGCGCSVESVQHVLQVCPRTHNKRVERHDKIRTFVAKRLGDSGCLVEEEKTFVLEQGNLRPDIICKKGNRATILDIHVVSEDRRLTQYYSIKRRSYAERRDLLEAVRRKYGVDRVEVAAITVTWRGCMAKESAMALLELGLRKNDLQIVSLRALEGSIAQWRTFNRRVN